MKGPGLRIDLDVRRIWRCAKCGKTVRTAVQVVAQRCGCADAPWMTLQPPVKREPFRPPVREPLPEIEAESEKPVAVSVAAGPQVVEPPAAALPAAESAPAGLPAGANPPAAEAELATAAPPAAGSGSASVEPAAPEPAPASPPPPDDFGAGLDDVSPETPA